MEYIDSIIKECNLIFTNTNTKLDFCRVNYNFDNEKVNYKNCINILSLITAFNRIYQLFKKEYEELDKLDLGEKVEVAYFEKFKYDSVYRNLTLNIDNPTITNRDKTILVINEINNKISSFVTNNDSNIDNFYHEKVELDKNKVLKYLDIFEKYKSLIDAYNFLKNRVVFGDGTYSICTMIDNGEGNILDGINKLYLIIATTYFDEQTFIKVAINLGEKLSIDHNRCNYFINNNQIRKDEEFYNKILNDIYVNKKHIKK